MQPRIRRARTLNCLTIYEYRGIIAFMNANKLINRGHLLRELRLKDTHITSIVTRSKVFKSIPKQQGYAINYTFNQALLIYTGCVLFDLGLSFRHIDDLLFELSLHDFESEKARLKTERWMVIIFKDQLAGLIKVNIKMGKDTSSGETLVKDITARKAPLTSRILPKKDFSLKYSTYYPFDMIDGKEIKHGFPEILNETMVAHIRLELYLLAEKVDSLYR